MTMAEVGFGERDAKQKTLFDCRKVVKLDASAVCFSVQDIEALKPALLDPATSKHALLNSLRKLDCYKLAVSDISSTAIGHVVAALAMHPQPEVARLAGSIAAKWSAMAGDDELFCPSTYDYDAASGAPEGEAETYFLKAPPTAMEIAAAERAAIVEARRATLRQRLQAEERMFDGCSDDEEDAIESASSSSESEESDEEWQPGKTDRKKKASKRKQSGISSEAAGNEKDEIPPSSGGGKQQRLRLTAAGPQLVAAEDTFLSSSIPFHSCTE